MSLPVIKDITVNVVDSIKQWTLNYTDLVSEGNYSWCYGPYGSGPLEAYYHKTMAEKARHVQIPDPKTWVEISTIKSKENYGWFKDTKDRYGFGILNAGWGGHDYVTGTWIWVNHPTCVADSGADVGWDSGWKFSPVEIPFIKNNLKGK